METTLDLVWGWTDGSATYRGPDRRRASTGRVNRGSYKLFGRYIVGGQLVIVATYLAGSRWGGSTTEADWLTPSVAVVSALAAGLFALWWRLVGDAAALWVASALAVYAAVNIAFPDLLRSIADTEAEASALSVLRPASVIIVMGLLVIGALSSRVDAGLSGRRVLLGTVGIAALATAAATWSADVRLLFGPAIDVAPSHVGAAIGQVGVGAAWLALAAVFLARSRRDWEAIDAWVAVMLIGFAEARFSLGLSAQDPAWLLASQAGRLLAVTAALVGILHELQSSFALQRCQLRSIDSELTIARSRQAAERANAEERAHDLRSALAGIGGAAATLERYHEHLSAEERATLARSVATEIARVQHLLADEPSDRTSFAVASVLEPVISCARAQGAVIRPDLPPGLSAQASPGDVAEVVQNLLDNARRHAPGAAVDVRARRIGDRVELRVTDAGPGIDPEIADRIFERGVHGSTPGSSGLGLYVAERLARANGGELGAATGEAGGASFTLMLPTPTPEIR